MSGGSPSIHALGELHFESAAHPDPANGHRLRRNAVARCRDALANLLPGRIEIAEMTTNSVNEVRAVAGRSAPTSPLPPSIVDALARVFAASVVWITLAFTLNFFLIFVWGFPGLPALFSDTGWFGFAPLRAPLEGAAVLKGWVQASIYALPIAVLMVWIAATRARPLQPDAEFYSALAGFIVRFSFWSVFLVGVVDSVLSFLRVEDFLPALFGEEMTIRLGQSVFRGQYIHMPLLALSCVIALFTRSLSFIWLSLLIVLAEFQIVITRFIFSYEQAFMGDLVRFWYASLFLLASAYSLIDEGHVRVDVFYTRFTERGKAWTNAVGSVLLGIPLCWIILTMGLWNKGSILANPLLTFEISQSGFGMYVKYLMVGLLIVFALSMAAQFTAYFLESVAVLRRTGTDSAAHRTAAPPP